MDKIIIKNEEQYLKAKGIYESLIKKTIPEWDKKKDKSEEGKMQYNIFVGQAEEYKQSIDEYEDLVSGKVKTIEINSIIQVK